MALARSRGWRWHRVWRIDASGWDSGVALSDLEGGDDGRHLQHALALRPGCGDRRLLAAGSTARRVEASLRFLRATVGAKRERSRMIRDSRPLQAEAHERRHAAAIASTLRQADEAAAGGDYEDALSWLGLLETIGDELPADYQAKRQAWHSALASGDSTGHRGSGASDGGNGSSAR